MVIADEGWSGEEANERPMKGQSRIFLKKKRKRGPVEDERPKKLEGRDVKVPALEAYL